MNRKEIIELIYSVTVAFPGYLSKASDRQKQVAIDLWGSFLAKYPAEMGNMALNEYLRTTKTVYGGDNVPLALLEICEDVSTVARGRKNMTFVFEPINEYCRVQRAAIRQKEPERKPLPARNTSGYDWNKSPKIAQMARMLDEMGVDYK